MNRENSAPAEELIWRTVKRYSMLTGAERVVAGFSGGADSMALVHFLWKAGVPLLAAHVNHGLRGQAAAADEECVRRFCAERDIPLRVLHADAAAAAAEHGEGIEAAGRRIRYGFFEALCGPNDKIATAHTLSDQAETVLLHLTRGSGIKGLCGIPPVRGRVIRPLIGVTRAQVEDYCSGYDLRFVTDQSNFSREYARNRVRLDVIPALRELNPSFEQAVGRMTHLLAEDEACLSGLAVQVVQEARVPGGWRIAPLSALPRPVLSRALRQIAEESGLPALSRERTEAAMRLLQAGSGRIDAGGGLFFAAQGGILHVVLPVQQKNSWSVPLQVPKTLTPGGREVIIRTLSRAEYENMPVKIRNLLFHNALDYDTIKNNSIIRGRRPGDAFSPAGRGVTKSLKKLMNEEKIPVSSRGGLLLLENSGQILWIETVGAAEQARIRPDTKQIAYISVKECNS
ncbi:tRNA lysidine(34) synthetase TilS [Faecalispora anaeroviscerum]|uniref:tRNA lysidine(34) synthetase TilS n=1 Tax=Faecalispora anaeroviscerum TaxID=2991836 RepID=UPI0024BA78B2|nr:tRNA lysidine(34) synthetase TilS [Faecalispora anaeroviscerum]